MKKLFAVLLAMFLLTACTAENDPASIETINGMENTQGSTEELSNDANNTKNNQTDSPKTESPNDQTVSSAETTNNYELSIDYIQEFFYDYDEYLEWLPTGKVTDRFVSYEMVSQFGAFRGVVFLSSYMNDYSIYMYSFLDSDGNDCAALYVDEKGEHGKPKLDVTILQHTGNMAELSQPAKGYVYHEGIVYRYGSEGKLGSIYWENDGMSFLLNVDNPSEYVAKNNENSFIAKLLNSNTAEAAMNQWKADLNQALAK